MNHKSNHTPGPWNEINGFITAKFTSNGQIYHVCDPRCAPSDTVELMAEMDANSRLIAAAPALLEALQKSMPWLGKALADGLHKDTGAPNDLVAVFQQSWNLLKQVKGEILATQPGA